MVVKGLPIVVYQKRLDRADHGWGADVGGGGEEVAVYPLFILWLFLNGIPLPILSPSLLE